jgi:hypothetical protein
MTSNGVAIYQLRLWRHFEVDVKPRYCSRQTSGPSAGQGISPAAHR